MSLLITNGKVYTKGEFKELNVLIEGGKIKKLGRTGMKADDKYDAKGMPVFPGLIDPHVHLRDPGAEKKEDFDTGTRAAVAGGFTAVMDMPNNPVPTTTARRLQEKRTLAARKAHCSVYFHFGATEENYADVRECKARSLKVYMGLTTGDLKISRSAVEHQFSELPGKAVVTVHAATDEKDEEKDLEKSMSNMEFAIKMGKKYGKHVHIAHASVKPEVMLTKDTGVTVEVAPHHIFLSKSDAHRMGPLGTVYPALRSEKRRVQLLGAIKTTDCIATDHAPHTLDDKEAGAHGFPGLETSLPLMLELYRSRVVPPDFIATRMSENPARIFGLTHEGKIEPGFKGNLTIVDLKKEWAVKGDELQTKCKWSPFEGRKMKGRAHAVIHKENLILDDGELQL